MWSDENHHQIENVSIAFSKRTLSLHGLSEKATAVQSPETMLIESLERQEMYHSLTEGLDCPLPLAQRRQGRLVISPSPGERGKYGETALKRK